MLNIRGADIIILKLYKIVIYSILCHFIQATVSIKLSKFVICFCSFYLSCPILEKENYIEFFYCIALSCFVIK